MLSFNIFWGCCLIIWELQNQTCYLLCPRDSLCLEAESQPETKWSLKHISKDCVANYHYAGHLEHCPKVEAISDHYLVPSFLNSNIKLLVFKGMPCHMCEWVCCLLCLWCNNEIKTKTCLNIQPFLWFPTICRWRAVATPLNQELPVGWGWRSFHGGRGPTSSSRVGRQCCWCPSSKEDILKNNEI